MLVPQTAIQRGWIDRAIDGFFGIQRDSNIDNNKIQKLIHKMIADNMLMRVDNSYKVSGSVKDLKKALTLGPVIVLVSASSPAFKFHRGGIIPPEACSKKTDHAVLAVGYGREKSKDPKTPNEFNEYFIIKNSWGRWWGDGGYGKLSASTKNNKGGTCGLLKYPYIGFIKDMSKPI